QPLEFGASQPSECSDRDKRYKLGIRCFQETRRFCHCQNSNRPFNFFRLSAQARRISDAIAACLRETEGRAKNAPRIIARYRRHAQTAQPVVNLICSDFATWSVTKGVRELSKSAA